MAAEKVKNPRGWMVDVRGSYEGIRCFLTEDGKAGVAVTPDGDIVSLFSSARGDHRMETLVPFAIEMGGRKCDCYGGGLQNLYARFGARAVGLVEFNEKYAPPDWRPGYEKPPIVAMIFPRSAAEAIQRFNRSAEINLGEVPLFSSYVEMLAHRDKLANGSD